MCPHNCALVVGDVSTTYDTPDTWRHGLTADFLMPVSWYLEDSDATVILMA
jgi:hypothetical protein